MTVAAIICEYNPLHNGHKFHIEETRRKTGADAVVAIMSGNFVQRGDAAIYPKSLRAKAAILGGADLVLELPVSFATGSAEFFAQGAVRTLDSLGIIDYLSFGAECNNAEKLLGLAELFANEPPEFTDLIKLYSKDGLSFPAARAKAAAEFAGADAGKILSSPNNILGIEYCKALLKLNSKITPCVIERTGAGHDTEATNGNIASASFIRKLLVESNPEKAFLFMPDFAKKIFENQPLHSIKAIENALLCELIKSPTNKLREISDVSEGLENRIKDAALTANSLEELIASVKTKRYAHSRVRRIVLSAFLGITDNDRKAPPQYIKILDHNETGQKLIAAAKKTATLPIVRNTSQVNKLGNSEIKELWERERIFDKIYEMTKI
ncbi:MAG: nucleotidyltransferase [Ruminococcaceae bacterium]|nr:nucleotidyltransferase [Oscillospiraceae bacterium]